VTPGISREDGDLRIRIMKGMELTTLQFALLLVGLAVLFAIPDLDAVSQDIRMTLWQRGLAFGMAAIGLNLLLRHAELVSFGHAAFFGTGAYTAALLTSKLGIRSFVIIFAAALAFGILVSAIIGYFTLHHKGLYFALITLAFGQVLFSIAKGVTELGGTDGLNVLTQGGSLQDRVPEFLGFAFTKQDIAADVFYWLSAIMVVVGLLVMLRLARSPFGRALDAIGQERTRARFLGLAVRRYVWAAFIISGIYGAIGGVIYAVGRGSVRPVNTLEVFISGDILYMAILGGFETLTGPLFGAVIYENLVTLADQILITDLKGGTLPAGNLVTGLVLLVIVFGFPSGVVGSLKPGGKVYQAGVAIRRNPAIVGTWARNALVGTGNALKRSASNVRMLIFGVN
jgi:branched-chain amino acid transport system permease protein